MTKGVGMKAVHGIKGGEVSEGGRGLGRVEGGRQGGVGCLHRARRRAQRSGPLALFSVPTNTSGAAAS